MKRTDPAYAAMLQILTDELRPATGCTEPIAIAYACAKARQTLGRLPERVALRVSGNIIKNVKSVVVPNTGGRRGLAAAAAAGIVAGDADAELECIAHIPPAAADAIGAYLARCPVSVFALDTRHTVDIDVCVYAGPDSARVRIVDKHTNIVCVERCGQALLSLPVPETLEEDPHIGLLTVERILDFADSAALSDIREPVMTQLTLNMAIAREGLAHDYGASIGKGILVSCGDSLRARMRALAAAGSDARMSGCEMPVVIVSGSGNQGITACVPVAEYARANGVGEEKLCRALVVADLLTVHQKTRIGRLSAFCGAVNAACGAAAAIAYMDGTGQTGVAHTLVNALAIVSGMVCDGAKPSCAAKIALALEAGFMGYDMFKAGTEFVGGDGIVKKGVENTLLNVGRLGGRGMAETDREILRMMTED